jgi:hypothetical protein
MVNSIQHEITKTMYTILIDWLIEIGTISDHTLCLAVHILDEYLHTSVIARSHFQLVGCTCLLIASKLEEIQFPSIDDLVVVACNCFTAEEVIAMEQKILRTLNYDIPRPTRSYFMERFLLVSRADCLDLQTRKKSQQQSVKCTTHHAAPATLFPATSSSPTSVRNNPSPALSTLTDDESSPLCFSAISSHFEGKDSQWATTPTKATAAAAAREDINSLDDVDLTSNESHSQLFSSPSSSFPRSTPSSFIHNPKHGYVPSSSQFLREESFARLLLHLTLQVCTLLLLTPPPHPFAQDYSFNQYRMSKVAAAIIHLAKQVYSDPLSLLLISLSLTHTHTLSSNSIIVLSRSLYGVRQCNSTQATKRRN